MPFPQGSIVRKCHHRNEKLDPGSSLVSAGGGSGAAVLFSREGSLNISLQRYLVSKSALCY